MYKITIEKIEEYPEMETVYESTSGGTRYYSKYHEDLKNKIPGKDYIEKSYPTGKLLQRSTEIYEQTTDIEDITDVIAVVNNIK